MTGFFILSLPVGIETEHQQKPSWRRVLQRRWPEPDIRQAKAIPNKGDPDQFNPDQLPPKGNPDSYITYYSFFSFLCYYLELLVH